MSESPKFKNNLATGAMHFKEGLELLTHRELRWYIAVPLVVNVCLFFLLTWLFIDYYGNAGEWLLSKIPSFLAPLAWIVWIIVGIILLVVYGYSFNIITNIIAAPFYGKLAARTEELLTGVAPPDEPLGKMIFRVVSREISKLIYFLSRSIIVLLLVILLSTIPVLQILAPAVGLAWGAWSMAIQYTDYAADNHQRGFKPLRNCLWQKKYSSLGFGGFVMLCSIIPVINIIAMPAAVIGGTIFWLKELNSCNVKSNQLG
ncbi:MAG: sulfate transporter CysZ [Alteromonadaceae bacterium]|nr:MAG: sulfate transporter CysZ [Alteromonadaceae bacterium]